MSYGYIYKTTNIDTNKIYIGKRKGEFDSSYIGSGVILKRSVERHGKQNFKVEIISHAESKESLNKLEVATIEEYRKNMGKNNLYNVSPGGDGGRVCEISPRLGMPNSEETRKKMSIAHKKRWMNPTWDENKRRKRMSEVHSGKIVSEETRKLMSDRQKGTSLESRGHTETCLCSFCRAKRGEFKGRISPLRGRKWSPESIQKRTETFKRNRMTKNGK